MNVKDLYTNARNLFGNEVKRRIILGNKALSIDEYERFFKKAQQIRNLIQLDFQNIFDQGITSILSPTTPTTTFSFDEFEKLSPLETFKSDIFTIHANLGIFE
jgi:aspartyl-tRNA(Asn)/glutamyl-tRNA(Gln) amidotransferase subunit A